MKTAILFTTASMLFLLTMEGFSQTLNWARTTDKGNNILNANIGWEYGLIYGIGYTYRLKSEVPILLNAEFSIPSGENVYDDFKTKIGGQVRVYQSGNLHVAARIQGVFRRSQNDYVRLVNFGSDMAATVGYYKPKWFVAGEFGFDKAIVTHFKHSSEYKSGVYETVHDGWYQPSTGGNFYYGIQAGYSFTGSDVYMKFGKVTEQDFRTSQMVPYYLQMGVNISF